MQRTARLFTARAIQRSFFTHTIRRNESVPETIDIETFAKINLCVGTIKKVDTVPKSEKLLRIEVDLGQFNNEDGSHRVILSGVRKSYPTEQDIQQNLLEKQCMVVENLAPRKMMGQLSHGMICFAAQEDKVVLVNPVENVANGTQVR
jgi:methionyl-tRNA synthetase